MTLEDEILERIVPTAEQRASIDGTASRLKALVQDYLDAHGIDACLRLVGSYSKDTYLWKPDLDLFIMFPQGTPRECLVDTGLKIGEEVLHGTRMYAEHPYTSAVFEGVDVDLVPNIHIDSTEHMVTAVDRTPFHSEYVVSAMKEGQADQIRLLKKFMKGIGTYGAEPNVRGFSGYLCEILVLKYGTFRKVLEAATGWYDGIQLDLERKHNRLEGAMVFYDPVDGKRNVASAVHPDTFNTFIAAAKAYLAHPSERFFFPVPREPLADNGILAKASDGRFRLLSVSFDRPDTVDDNLYAQLWKTRYALEAKLNAFGFTVLRTVHRADSDGMEIAFMLSADTLGDCVLREGPAPYGKNAEHFLEKWNESGIVRPFILDGKWCAVVPRPYTSAPEMLAHELPQAGIGRNVDLKSARILGHDDTVSKANRMLLTELLEPRMPWEN